MTDKELSYIIKIAETKNITSAANQLFVSQPALTQALQKVEDSIGKIIFNRTKNGLILTNAGKEYIKAAYKIQKIYRDMEMEIGYISSNIKGKLRIGITSYLGAMILPSVLSIYNEKFPQVTVELFEGNSTELEDMITSGKVDMAVMHQPIKDVNLLLDVITKDDFVLAISKKNVLLYEKKPTVATIDILSNLPMIMISQDQRIGQVENYILKTLNINPKIVYTTKNFDTARNLAAVDLGIALLPKSYVKYFQTQHHPIYLNLPAEWNGSWDLCLAYPKGLKISKACSEFSMILKDYIFKSKEYFDND